MTIRSLVAGLRYVQKLALCATLFGGCAAVADDQAAGSGEALSDASADDNCATTATSSFCPESGALNPVSARWVHSSVSVLAARRVVSDPEVRSRLELDLLLSLRGPAPSNYVNHAAWTLKLADGATLQPVNAEHVLLLTQTPQHLTLHYDVDREADLCGAALILNAANPEQYEPETVSIGGEYTQTFPRRIQSLVEQSVPQPGAAMWISDALYDVNSALNGRAARGKRAIVLQLESPDALSAETAAWIQAHLSLHTGDMLISPDTRKASHANDGSSVAVEFEIDASATAFDIDLGDAQPHHVDLTQTTFASDIP